MMHGKEGQRWMSESRKSYFSSISQLLRELTSNIIPCVKVTRCVVFHPIAILSASTLRLSRDNGLRRSVSTNKDDELIRQCSRQPWAIYDIAWTAFDVLVVGPATTHPRSPEALRRRKITVPSEPELAPLGGFESAAQQLAGRAVGAHNQPAFLRALRLTAGGAFSLAGFASVLALGVRRTTRRRRNKCRGRACGGGCLSSLGGFRGTERRAGLPDERGLHRRQLVARHAQQDAHIFRGLYRCFVRLRTDVRQPRALGRLSHFSPRAGGKPAVDHASPCSHRLRGMIVDRLILMYPVKAEGEREQLLGASVQSRRIGWCCTGP